MYKTLIRQLATFRANFSNLKLYIDKGLANLEVFKINLKLDVGARRKSWLGDVR